MDEYISIQIDSLLMFMYCEREIYYIFANINNLTRYISVTILNLRCEKNETSNGREEIVRSKNYIYAKLFGLLDDIGNDFFGLFGQFFESLVSSRLMFQEVWTNDSVIDDRRSVVREWQHAPNEENALKIAINAGIKTGPNCDAMRVYLPSIRNRMESPLSIRQRKIPTPRKRRTWPNRSTILCRLLWCWSQVPSSKHRPDKQCWWCCKVIVRPHQTSNKVLRVQQPLEWENREKLLIFHTKISVFFLQSHTKLIFMLFQSRNIHFHFFPSINSKSPSIC